MAALPIPDVVEVREVHAPSVHSFVIIAPDYMAGRKHAYSAIRIHMQRRPRWP